MTDTISLVNDVIISGSDFVAGNPCPFVPWIHEDNTLTVAFQE